MLVNKKKKREPTPSKMGRQALSKTQSNGDIAANLWDRACSSFTHNLVVRVPEQHLRRTIPRYRIAEKTFQLECGDAGKNGRVPWVPDWPRGPSLPTDLHSFQGSNPG
uniref:Uncharacterized protein n=1 Tax=Bionectria ochroleuca TaxID=29856 RepID=A0A8H7NJJ6_BIOOC